MKLSNILSIFILLLTPLILNAKEGDRVVVGDRSPEIISAYYIAKPQSLDSLKAKLVESGFTILASSHPLKGVTTLTLTNKQLKATNSFASTINLVVNGTKEIRVQNPSYFGAAYLQDKFIYGQFKDTQNALKTALGELFCSKDELEFDELASYHFMIGMPYFEETIEVGRDINITNISDTNSFIAYSLKLSNGSILVGHKLAKDTNLFLHKLDESNNSLILPYKSMVIQNRAITLDPKYYLALSLPLLTMKDFMKIAKTPKKIIKDIKKAYN